MELMNTIDNLPVEELQNLSEAAAEVAAETTELVDVSNTVSDVSELVAEVSKGGSSWGKGIAIASGITLGAAIVTVCTKKGRRFVKTRYERAKEAYECNKFARKVAKEARRQAKANYKTAKFDTVTSVVNDKI